MVASELPGTFIRTSISGFEALSLQNGPAGAAGSGSPILRTTALVWCSGCQAGGENHLWKNIQAWGHLDWFELESGH
jgi:hypothetical protein